MRRSTSSTFPRNSARPPVTWHVAAIGLPDVACTSSTLAPDAPGQFERVRDRHLAQPARTDRLIGDHGSPAQLNAHRPISARRLREMAIPNTLELAWRI